MLMSLIQKFGARQYGAESKLTNLIKPFGQEEKSPGKKIIILANHHQK